MRRQSVAPVPVQRSPRPRKPKPPAPDQFTRSASASLYLPTRRGAILGAAGLLTLAGVGKATAGFFDFFAGYKQPVEINGQRVYGDAGLEAIAGKLGHVTVEVYSVVPPESQNAVGYVANFPTDGGGHYANELTVDEKAGAKSHRTMTLRQFVDLVKGDKTILGSSRATFTLEWLRAEKSHDGQDRTAGLIVAEDLSFEVSRYGGKLHLTPKPKSKGGGGGGGGGCFPPETLVLLEGGRLEAIGNLTVGAPVQSWDFATQSMVTTRVVRVHHLTASRLLQMNGLQVTPDHPFAVGPNRWRPAGALALTQPLAGPDPSVVTTLTNLPHHAAVVNLTVSGPPPNLLRGHDDRCHPGPQQGGLQLTSTPSSSPTHATRTSCTIKAAAAADTLKAPVVNLTVSPPYSFFVTDSRKGYLVHNKGGAN